MLDPTARLQGPDLMTCFGRVRLHNVARPVRFNCAAHAAKQAVLHRFLQAHSMVSRMCIGQVTTCSSCA